MSKCVKAKIIKKRSDFDADKYLDEASNTYNRDKIKEIAEESLKDLIKASPTIEIANSWSYDIISTIHGFKLIFMNDATENGMNIAIIMDVGHATIQGYWVPGKNYLKEPIKNTYKRINEMMEAL